MRLQRRLNVQGEAVSWAAESLFHFVEKKYYELKKVRLTKSPRLAAKAIKKKQAMLARLEIDLKKVIKFNDGYQVVASLTLSGMAHAEIYRSFMAAPVPKELLKASEAERLKAYRAQLSAQVADPIKKAAITLFKDAIDKASRLESYDEWVLTAHRELAKLDENYTVDFDEKVIQTRLPDWLDRKISSGDSKVDKDKLRKLKDFRKSRDLKGVKGMAAEILAESEFDLYTLNTLALTFFSQKRLGLAKILLERAISKHKNIPALYNNYGIIYLSEGKKKKAIAAFRQSLDISKKYRVANTNLGSIYLEYKDYGRALAPLEGGYEIVKAALKKDNNDFAINVANNYALALKGTGSEKQSRRVFSRLVDAGANDAGILMNFASLLVEKFEDEKDEAISVISKIKIATSDRAILKKAEKLEKVVYAR